MATIVMFDQRVLTQAIYPISVLPQKEGAVTIFARQCSAKREQARDRDDRAAPTLHSFCRVAAGSLQREQPSSFGRSLRSDSLQFFSSKSGWLPPHPHQCQAAAPNAARLTLPAGGEYFLSPLARLPVADDHTQGGPKRSSHPLQRVRDSLEAPQRRFQPYVVIKSRAFPW